MKLTKQYANDLLADLYLSVYQDLQKANNILQQEPEYVNLLESQVDEQDKFREIFKDEIQPQVLNFLNKLATDGALSRLDTIVEDYKQSLIETEVLNVVEVSSANPVSSEFKEKVEEFIGQRWGENYLVNFVVDKELIGGVRMTVNDAVIDTTFRSRINQILKEV